jgi:hypothetical protein
LLDVMLLLIGIVLAIAWILGWGMFHVASAAIHLLLLFAVIAVVLHFVRAVAGGQRRRYT